MRASDAEREAAVERLRVAVGEGRLTLEELTERTEAAYLARTRDELARITDDLPADTAPAAPARTGEPVRLFAVMGDTVRKGVWSADGPVQAFAVMGDVTIDLCDAQVGSDTVEISAAALMGDIKVIVPEGVAVELEGVTVLGDKRDDTSAAPTPAGQARPRVRVRAYTLMGDVKVRHPKVPRKRRGHFRFGR
ncbi:cell wall-active antibiotic response 4TMS protein YvqF [Allonocardiopsis opalescens]|uniref:Cell wall-active antibiotic response 4TMS protein YvqF n=2 Tax=Allonocardiopsis opalescens TaxID=1144618 RepID=A0A2T0PTZ0_9ACTN|nr:cell wall-active antibiotic response 4TMS protein YvqF [Allonocardiopsis opalescens]